MNIIIRHEISDTYEEVYHFDVDIFRINYKGVEFSYRENSQSVWGYDWTNTYKNDEQKEITDALSEYNLDEDDISNVMNSYEPYKLYEKLTEIRDAYNPVCNKTSRNENYLSGIFGSDLKSQYPINIPKEELVAKILYQISKSLYKNINKLYD